MEIPLNATIMVLGVSLVLGAINFGSDLALDAVISVSNAALIFSYIISIGCVRLKRLRGQTLLPRRWSLGRWGGQYDHPTLYERASDIPVGPINDISLAYLVIAFVFSFFPADAETNVVGMNWAIAMLAGVSLLALLYYMIDGRKKYISPASIVKKE